MHVFWLKIGHWRIMWYIVIIISEKLFSIHWALIYPDLIQGAQDTLQTPSRHPPDTPCWSLFWPNIGHWEKMSYLFKMISTRPFPIDLALIHLRHNPEGPWHPPDTHQTPNRHPTDTQLIPYRQPKMHVLLAENRSLCVKPIYGKMILAGLFSMNLASIYLKHNPECPRHPPDSQQTLPDSHKYTIFSF